MGFPQHLIWIAALSEQRFAHCPFYAPAAALPAFMPACRNSPAGCSSHLDQTTCQGLVTNPVHALWLLFYPAKGIRRVFSFLSRNAARWAFNGLPAVLNLTLQLRGRPISLLFLRPPAAASPASMPARRHGPTVVHLILTKALAKVSSRILFMESVSFLPAKGTRRLP